MFEEYLDEVVEVGIKSGWALVECLTEAANNHNLVTLRVVVAKIFDELGSKTLHVRHKAVLEALCERDDKIGSVTQDELIMVKVFIIFLSFAVFLLLVLLVIRAISNLASLAWSCFVKELLDRDDNPL